MFRKSYKEINKNIEMDPSLKEDTINKMLNIEEPKRRSTNIFKFVAITGVILVVGFGLLFRNNKVNIMDIGNKLNILNNIKVYAISEPVYPTKIKFDDYDKKWSRREDIDESFLKNLKDFSIKSSSLVLREIDKDKNGIYSPISLYMALSMVAETANGDTQKEILEALNMDSIDIVRSETGKLFRKLYFHNEIGKLSLGNSLWLDKDVGFKKELLDFLAKDYYASSFNLDFNDNESPKKVSKWVSEQTGGKLGNNSDDFSFGPDQVMTLINTIYFYDEWVDRFNEENTKEDKFYLSDGEKVRTDFMNRTHGSHGYVDGDNYTASRLNFKNNGGMVFILPDKGVSPYDIIQDPRLLDEAINSSSTDKYKSGEVVFKIPKFDFSSKLKLKDIVKSMGIENVFDLTADFTNLSDTKPLFISGINQNATISIDEKGVEAAAYTEIDYCGSAMPDGRAEMILNRPFIFAITGVDGSPLFIGIINNPNIN